MRKKHILVLFGGASTEHEVSLISGASVLRNIDRERFDVFPVGIKKDGSWFFFGGENIDDIESGAWEKCAKNRRAILSPSRGDGLIIFDGEHRIYQPIDCAFPVLHGANGEDGTMQGLFEITGIPYVGPGVGASANAMDKSITKILAANAGIKQAKSVLINRRTFLRDENAELDRTESVLNQYPVFVKPSSSGSSVGVSKAKNRDQLRNALQSAAQYDRKILVEEYIEGHEVEVAVLGNDEPIASCVGEIVSSNEFYDYAAKYIDNACGLYIPARIPEETAEKVRRTAIDVYRALDCRGLSRADFFVRYSDQEVIFNEINTIPGFTGISMYPKLFAASGIPYGELISRLIDFAMEEK